MKNFYFLMSLAFILSGSCSVGIAMEVEKNGWEFDGDSGIGKLFDYEESDTQIEESRNKMLEAVKTYRNDGEYSLDPNIEDLEKRLRKVSIKKRVNVEQQHKKVCEEVINYGKKHRGGECLPDGIRLIDEKREEATHQRVREGSEVREAYDLRINKAKKAVIQSLEKREYAEPNMRAFNREMESYSVGQKEKRKKRESSWYEENQNRDELYKANIEASIEASKMYDRCVQEVLESRKELKHEKTESRTEDDQKALFSTLQKIAKNEKDQLQQNLRNDVMRHYARLMNLGSPSIIHSNRAFNLQKWSHDLMNEVFFSTTKGLKIGKKLAFDNGDILALIGYAEYLNQLFQSKGLFFPYHLKDLLTVALMIYVRVAQDVHAVLAVNELVNTLDQESLLFDGPLKKWKSVASDGYFSFGELSLCSRIQEKLVFSLFSIWKDRIENAEKAGNLESFDVLLNDVKEKIKSMNSSHLPPVAVVCCLHGLQGVQNPTKELAEISNMFDFENLRKEGAETAFNQLDCFSGSSWSDFMNRLMTSGSN